uniref:Syntaxin N-terminal domain-containing protein n=1 Tax=viral metagenome TaxID=1070528 RepID=A0A6M3IF90_9ZZZZ
MLSKIIKLEDIKDDFDNTDNHLDDRRVIRDFMEFTIEAFKTLTDEVVRLKEMVKSQSYQISDLRKRVNSSYPNEEEIKSMKVGGTD